MYKEALNHFGSITSDMDDESEESGAFRFSHYFANEGVIYTASSETKHTYYPNSVVMIDSSMVIDIDGVEFDGNYLIYQFPITQAATQFSETFTFQFCKGTMSLNNIRAVNMHGIDISEVNNYIGKC